VSSWLSRCDKNHTLCGSIQRTYDGKTPARLVHVGTTLNPSLSLVNSLGPEIKFAALSYCWGDAKQVKLQNENLAEFTSAIPEDTLPQTIKDAIILTRALDISHIWIDALCIIQDNAYDWEVEAAKMASVYGGAHVVISAARGESCESGFLGPRRYSHQAVYLGSDGRNPEPMYAFLEAGNCVDAGERMHDFVLSGYLSEKNLATACPVYGRGWCLQEQVLAARLVHFTDSEMVMECAEAVACECDAVTGQNKQQCLPNNPPELPPTPRKPHWYQTTRIAKDVKQVLGAWWSCVEQYSVRHLSAETDRLPAISGIAESLSECGLGSYGAGIWEADLPSGLLWGVIPRHPAKPRRPAEYTAPSWSWASVMAPVLRPDQPLPLSLLGDKAGLLPARAEVVKVECEPRSVSPFGRLLGASLILKATVIALEARSISDQGVWHDYLELYCAADDRRDGVRSIVPHYPLNSCAELDVFPSRESRELNAYLGTLVLLAIMIDYNGPGTVAQSFGALLVIPSDHAIGAFIRIGRVNLWVDDMWKPEVLNPREILLI
jgi:hypothetical protein